MKRNQVLFILFVAIIVFCSCDNLNKKVKSSNKKIKSSNYSKELEIRSGYKDILLDEKIVKFNSIITGTSFDWIYDNHGKRYEAPNIEHYKIKLGEEYAFIGSSKIKEIELTTIYGTICEIRISLIKLFWKRLHIYMVQII